MAWDHAYFALLSHLCDEDAVSHGIVEIATNKRTGVRVRTLHGGACFKLDVRRGVPVPGNRRYYAKSAAAETAWQLMGTKDPEFIVRHAPRLWSKFVEDGELKASYGFRWRKAFGRDQINLALLALAEDPTTRQVFVQAWDPSSDGLGQPNQPKNIPCPLGFALSVTGGELHMSVFIRSSDVFVGLPYDVMNHAMLLHAFAHTIGRRPGTLTVSLSNAHLYEPHWNLAQHATTDAWAPEHLNPSKFNPISFRERALPHWQVGDIIKDPDGYVESWSQVKTRADWDPKPELVL